jgi:hypothetical protein
MQTPWAVILCKFTDGIEEPFSSQHYQDLFTAHDTGSPWNMIRYFRDYSHGSLDLTGTQVFGWYQLDKSVDDYNSLGSAARDQLIKWASDAAKAAGVDLTPFYRVVACTNLWHDIGASPSLSGVVAQGTTAVPRLLGHEMGHVYGLQHSRIDGSTEDYQDMWDIMSAANDFSTPDPGSEFLGIGPGLNAWNMRSRGWLDESRVWHGSGYNLDETVVLRPLVRRDLAGFLAAEMPGGYLLEFRVQEGWDAAIPRPAVLVHYFDGGHSYLVPGNSGQSDLIAGDSFGDPVPSGPLGLFSSYNRVDVVSIEAAAEAATLRFRYHRPPQLSGLAIDPMALVLSESAYLIWVEQHHPHVPEIAEIQAALRVMTPEQQTAALSRARTMAEYAQAVEQAIAAIRRTGQDNT